MLTRPSGSFRPLFAALVVALFVCLQALEGTGMHRCPSHDAGAGLQFGGTGASGHHHGGAHHGQDRDRDHAAGCECLGDCQNSPAFIASPPPVSLAPTAARPDGTPAWRGTPVQAFARYLLPFAIGPPLIA